ncbi:LysM peptidoglycan-binding domain-containing protein [Antribacter gilvus]|uniref:LysM peptidoglycan-binding domain-containing protein n=1 Tax=Antribacter gilvus TaxID=2304675 RepID=UPI000F769EA1|nr:LysM peptidoglycan-binding domain-containing protein [Antribacter gilvus]
MTTTRPRPDQPVQRPAPAAARRGRAAAVLALLGLAGLLAGIPYLLVVAHRYLWTVTTWDDLRLRLDSPDNGTLLAMSLIVVLWGLWAWLTVTVLIEIIAALRHAPAPHLPGLPQAFARRVVATALALAAVPAVTQSPGTAHAVVHTAPETGAGSAAAPVPTVIVPTMLDDARDAHRGRSLSTAAGAVVDSGPVTDGDQATPSGNAAAGAPPTQPSASVDHVVQPGETLWRIASEQLGNARRWTEIADLNPHLADPDFLTPGQTVRVPTSPASSTDVAGVEATSATTYIVQRGDTLSQIALDALGEADRYPDIADASSDTVQPDGDRLTDPDHIEPGWTLTVPGAATPVSDPLQGVTGQAASSATPPPADVDAPTGADADADADADAPSDHDGGNGGTAGAATATGTARQEGAPSADPSPHAGEETPRSTEVLDTTVGSDDAPATDEAAQAPSWLLPGLASGGSVLAAGLHLAITRGRARQERLRSPGRAVAPIPQETVSAAVSARVVGGRRAPDVRRLDNLLRELAGPNLRHHTPRPALVAVELTDDTATLHLATPAHLPQPWEGDGVRWSAPLPSAPGRSDELVPYPMLTAVGQRENGTAVLLDLEHLRTVAVTGDAEEVSAFARHVVAELALNPWTANLTTHVVGVAEGAGALSLHRVIEEHDDTFATDIGVYVKESAEAAPDGEDHEEFHIVVAAAPLPGITELADEIGTHPGRSSAAVVRVAQPPRAEDVELRIEGGRLRVDVLGIDVDAARMSVQELEACRRIVAFTRNPADVPNSLVEHATGRDTADQPATTAPRTEDPPLVRTTDRPADAATAAGDLSLLPEPDEVYTARTANTREDVARLAPVVQRPGDAADTDPDPDPRLDDDLADWYEPACRRPRLELLGPVTLWGPGPADGQEGNGLQPLFVMLAAYLALHPQGVTLEDVSAVLNENVDGDVRSRLSVLRGYVGNRPDGKPRLGRGTPGRPRKGAPPTRHLYKIDEILLDTDLLRRLYERALRRGADGLEDLVAALELVQGVPFTVPEEKYDQWVWAFHHERFRDEYTALVGDVAHLVITRALRQDDVPLARRAIQTWRLADPGNEALAKDHTLVELADEHPEKAKEIANELLTRLDDETGPGGPGKRSGAIDAAHRRARRNGSV